MASNFRYIKGFKYGTTNLLSWAAMRKPYWNLKVKDCSNCNRICAVAFYFLDRNLSHSKYWPLQKIHGKQKESFSTEKQEREWNRDISFVVSDNWKWYSLNCFWEFDKWI